MSTSSDERHNGRMSPSEAQALACRHLLVQQERAVHEQKVRLGYSFEAPSPHEEDDEDMFSLFQWSSSSSDASSSDASSTQSRNHPERSSDQSCKFSVSSHASRRSLKSSRSINSIKKSFVGI